MNKTLYMGKIGCGVALLSVLTGAAFADEKSVNEGVYSLLLKDPQLLDAEDMVYLGAFALPAVPAGSASRFGYGGRGITPYTDPDSGQKTLYMEGHAWYPGYVAQVAVPDSIVNSDEWSELPQAELMQNFSSVLDGNGWSSLGANQYEAIFGLLAYNERLIVGATSWYDAACNQTATHGVSSLELSRTDDFQGFYTLTGKANPRSIGGYMTPIPAEWQDDFGGPVLTGNAALSIIGCISSGPAATVFDPDALGNSDPVEGDTVVYYPLSNYLVSGGVTTENTFTFGSSVKGVAFPKGSRTVLFIGRQSLADGYCYGEGTDDPALHLTPSPGGTYCYDPCDGSKGGHGYPYVHWVWAYDAQDLLDAREGKIEPWEVQPYATWQLDEMNDDGCASIRGAGYDPDTRRLYITQGFGEQGRVDVYTITH